MVSDVAVISNTVGYICKLSITLCLDYNLLSNALNKHIILRRVSGCY